MFDTPRVLSFASTAVLALALSAASLRAGDFPGVDALAARRVPWMRHAVSFARLPAGGSTAGRFELRTRDGRLEVRATDASAAAMGLGWYLKYYCHRPIAHAFFARRRLLPGLRIATSCRSSTSGRSKTAGQCSSLWSS